MNKKIAFNDIDIFGINKIKKKNKVKEGGKDKERLTVISLTIKCLCASMKSPTK